jgi:aminoglycoside 6-adenylyltransferase
MRSEQQILAMLERWAKRTTNVRAMILTSSRAQPHAVTDDFSDYDIELFVKDLRMFQRDTWLSSFGSVMVRWPLKPTTTWSPDWITRLVLFEDGVKIDFQITDVATVKPVMREYGFTAIVDKDRLTTNLRKPRRVFRYRKPSKEEFQTVVNEFFWECTYVAKSLWRDELFFAKFSFDNVLRFRCLQPAIEWYIGMHHRWSVDGKYLGRTFKEFLASGDWRELESTYAGALIEDNWKALFNVIAFFRRIANAVAIELDYRYPAELDRKVSDYCRRAKAKKK